jgi:hypothetical protein
MCVHHTPDSNENCSVFMANISNTRGIKYRMDVQLQGRENQDDMEGQDPDNRK